MKTLILTADSRLIGGVSNYYNTLQLDQHEDYTYFYVNPPNHNLFSLLVRLATNYIRFCIVLLIGKYRLVHLNPSLDKRSFYRDSVFILLSHLFRRKTLVFFRGWEDQYEEQIKNSFWLHFIFKNSYARADKFIVLGNMFKKKLLSMGISPKKDFFLETTIADSAFLQQFDLSAKLNRFSKEVVVLFLSRIEKSKGIYLALEAFQNATLKCHEKKIKFIVAGDGPDLDNVKEFVQNKKLLNVEFKGFVKDEVKREVLMLGHILLFPTCYGEGLPNCILEGMLYGMPVITRNVGGIPEIIRDKINGFLSDSTESHTYTQYLLQLLTDKNLYEEIAWRNYRTAREKFTPDKVRKRLLKIYQAFSS